MKNSNDGIGLLEQQMANDEEVCCSYGNITAFPEAFFDNFRVADIGLIVCVKGHFTLSCEGTEYDVHNDETAFSRVASTSLSPAIAPTARSSSFITASTLSETYWAAPWWA